MKQSIHIILISILSLVTFFGISSFILLKLDVISGVPINDHDCLKEELSSQPLTSTGDFLGFYTTLSTASPPVPLNIDVVSFPSMNGASTTISTPWNSYGFTQVDAFLSTNGTTYDPQMKEMICFISGELQYLQYKDTPMSVNMGPMTFPVAAPVFLNGQYLAILVEDGGNATPPMLEADLVFFDPNFGNFSSVQHLQTTTPNPFTYFSHESMSSATNRVDELYFLSGTNLVIVTDFSIFTPHYCWIDMEPSNSSNNYHSFYGVEYKSPGVLLALRETFVNNTPHLDLVEIHFNSTTCTVSNIISVYDLQSNIPIAPGGWIINSEYYSTAFDSCNTTYYISSRYDAVTSSRLIEIDIPNSSHVAQILPQYLFGIEWKQKPCPCEASFVRQQFNSCTNFTFVNTSTGSAPMTCYWDFGDPNSGINNTSVQCVDVHQFSTCGTFNVCLIINANGCMETTCQLITVTDNTPPVARCKSGVAIALDANCMAVLQVSDIDNGSFDDCDLQSVSVSPNSFSACGNYPVTLTAIDWCGNTNTCMANIQVVDNVPPFITCPADVYLTTPGPNCSVAVLGGPLGVIAADNCGSPSLTYVITGASSYTGTGNASGLLFNVGTSFVTYTATDNCGNSTVCSFKVVVDCICICPNNLVQNAGFNQGSIMGNLGVNLYPGHTNNWFRITQSPWIDGTMYGCDPFSMYFFAYGTGGESIYQPGIQFLAGHTYKISYCTKSNLLYQFQATNSPVPGSYNPYNCSNCEIIGTSPQSSTAAWTTYTMPLWTANQNADVLAVVGIGNGCCGYHNKGWIDNLCVQEIVYSCCADQAAFEENASLLVNIRMDQSDENVLLDVGALLDCNSIAYIDWGDGSEIIWGPIPPNTRLTHIYSDTNVYEIQYLVQEFAAGDTSQVCFERIFTEFVQVGPDSCYCNAFSSMFIRDSHGAMNFSLTCGSSAISLECPQTGEGLSITGLFECTGTTCKDTSTIFWILSGPGGMEVGTASVNPFFKIDVRPTLLSQPGLYKLNIEGFCGNESCACEIQFIVECSDLCPCTAQSMEEFDNAVNAGFTQSAFNNSCKVCLTPNELSGCETVYWYINDAISIPLGSTTGSETFCYTFPGPDQYSISMQVDRPASAFNSCTNFTYEKDVEVNCSIPTECHSTSLPNYSFSEGAVSGNLNAGGKSDNWSAKAGQPLVINNSVGSNDDWTIQLSGNLDFADVLATTDPICLSKGKGTITGRNKVEHWGDPHENLNGKHLKDWNGKFVLFQGNDFDFNSCPATSCFEIASIDLSQVDSGWVEFQIEYDLEPWAAIATCQSASGAPGIEARLAIFATSPYTSDQGEPESRARFQLDELCLNELLVSVKSIDHKLSMQIYPNPNRGELIVELGEPASKVMNIRIISLTGEILNEIPVSSGMGVILINTDHLLTGMYFLQLISNGQPKTVNRFVKL